MTFSKKTRPVTKRIWSLLRYLPVSMRKRLIRSQFEINYDLSQDYQFSQAETPEEIEQALKIIYESYSKLGYIDQRPEEVHFNSFLCLPTTTILILKHKGEVIGTMSIVLDSPFGLPSETTWDLSQLKAKKKRIAEVSALTIKRGHKTSRGHLLLTLCKLMYEFSIKALKLDGVVMAATLEVEPFYTDILLFNKVVSKTGQEHQLVKGNKSTCCFLDFHEVRPDFIREYNQKPRNKNLFHFFAEYNSPNIRLPEDTISIHGLHHKKNMAVQQVLKKYPKLKEMFSSEDKLRLANLDPTLTLGAVIGHLPQNPNCRNARISIKSIDTHLFHGPTGTMAQAVLLDISSDGFKVKLATTFSEAKDFDDCVLIFNMNGKNYTIHASLQWRNANSMGFRIKVISSDDWQIFTKMVFQEIEEQLPQKEKSAA